MTRFNALVTAGCVAFTASVALGAPCDKQKTADACSSAKMATLASMKEGNSCSASKAAKMARLIRIDIAHSPLWRRVASPGRQVSNSRTGPC